MAEPWRGLPAVAIEGRFDVVVAPSARERRWGFRATYTESGRADGSILMCGVVRGVEGIVRELLAWMRHAEVLGGPELRADGGRGLRHGGALRRRSVGRRQ